MKHFLQIKKLINYFIAKNSFVVEVAFKLSYFFGCDPSLNAIFKKCELLDYVMLLHETVLGMTLKGLVGTGF